jgi:succinate dehydrogenase / fumarate reductase flavoprotein subunit
MYERITGENPYKVPMRIYPAVHYTMGGLWVDYNLMSNIPGLFVLGEANFSDHGANRLGASALMQGLADGYFVLPYTIGDYLAGRPSRQGRRPTTRRREAAEAGSRSAPTRLLGIKGKRTVDASTASSARSCGTTAAWPATEGRPEEGLEADPRAARGVLART